MMLKYAEINILNITAEHLDITIENLDITVEHLDTTIEHIRWLSHTEKNGCSTMGQPSYMFNCII